MRDWKGAVRGLDDHEQAFIALRASKGLVTIWLEAISKNGFWFKVKADVKFNPEEYSSILRA